VTRYTIDVCQYTHTCPADPRPHIIDTRQTVVERADDGPCRRPQTVRSGAVVAAVDCRRVLRTDQQCDACRPVITVRTVTTVDLGPAGAENLVRPGHRRFDHHEEILSRSTFQRVSDR
jgi:hypothetical protein